MNSDLLIYVVAGEPSGDVLGGRLMAALKRRTTGNIKFAGVGGVQMQSEGLKSLFPMEELSVMGIVEILPHIPLLLRRMNEVASDIERLKPDAVVTIDAPAFAHGVVKRIKGRDIPRIHYVAPQLWAWRPWRVRKFRRHFDHILALLPFEPDWFESRGVSCRFVGHPVLESGADRGDGIAFRARHKISTDSTVLCCLLGSRRGEINRHIEPFRAAITQLSQQTPNLICVLPTVPHLSESIHRLAAEFSVRTVVLDDNHEKFDAMAASDIALAASGTVALELSLARTPTVIAYKMATLTYLLGKPLINVAYANLVNLILNRPVIPEFLQNNCTGEKLSAALFALKGPAGKDQCEAVAPALTALGLGGDSPSDRAAEAVLEIVQQMQ
ncbi:MAG: lipid-A-disaccharide synthase [Alphaproteobacteria bacterium]|nr:lipid-A-disaccharide synthase [Alphaproteobacteria bacterium]